MKKKGFENKGDNKKNNLKGSLILLITLVAVVVLFYYAGTFNKECLNDACFDDALRECKPVDYTKHTNNNIYLYTIYRSSGEDCLVQISLQSVAPGSDRDIKDLLEGESMKCKIPKSLLAKKSMDEIDNVLAYCSGELKEGIYELIIKKLYGLVIGNVEEVFEALSDVIE
ncbi:MAG: hypothetical protein ABIB47_05180 [Candidatus Woesearchaeota archaeon]